MNRVSTPEDVEAALEVPVFGVIPLIPDRKRSRHLNTEPS